jgi:hypothetical protein
MGHFSRDCWAEGGRKAGPGPRGRSQAKKNKNAATATEDSAWAAHELDGEDEDPFEGLFDDDEMPGLMNAPDSDDDDIRKIAEI